MKSDIIIKNAKIFTAAAEKPLADALVVKDGRFVYVGDEAGLSDYVGEVLDLGGKFIMPGIIDSHVHVTLSVGYEYLDYGTPIESSSKTEALEKMAEIIRKDPGQQQYRFFLERKSLQGEDIVKEDLDRICPDGEVIIIEEEFHSIWMNSAVLKKRNITDDTPDPIPGLSYYVRNDGHVTGNAIESTVMPIVFENTDDITDKQIDDALKRWIDFSVNNGVSCVFDSGIPECIEFHERVYKRLQNMDRQGKLPVYIDGCYLIYRPEDAERGIDQLKRFNREYNTEHLKIHTLKIFMDGTFKIGTAALIKPYKDTNECGTTSFNKAQLVDLIIQLNEEGFDLHLHTVGDAASKTVLDAVETARKELGDAYRIKITCAHLEIQDDADFERFAELGVFANFSPWWHSGNLGDHPYDVWCSVLGEKRAGNMYRCKTLWDTGALVTWSSDEVYYDDFTTWNPYLGMEVGMTRIITENTKAYDWYITKDAFPSDRERMSIEEMILGYTINGAIQLGIEDRKGSIEVGKDADFLVFDNDLLTSEHEGFSYNEPVEVYFCGEKVK